MILLLVSVVTMVICYSGPPLDVVSLNQVEKDTVMVGYDHILCLLCMGVGLVMSSCDLVICGWGCKSDHMISLTKIVFTLLQVCRSEWSTKAKCSAGITVSV